MNLIQYPSNIAAISLKRYETYNSDNSQNYNTKRMHDRLLYIPIYFKYSLVVILYHEN